MSDPERPIRLRSSARTSVGQVRENNEDCVRLWAGDDFVLAVVADGMGGAAAGEEASRIAVESIQMVMGLRERGGVLTLDGLPADQITRRLRESIQKANLSIMQRSLAEPELRGMGTTVTLAFVRGVDVLIAHVGDSRGYQVNGFNHAIRQITSDHSFVEALLAAGHITREQAEEHPMRNVLYRALGQTEDIDIDLYHSDLQVGDRLILCSDGLTRHVRPGEIAEITMADDNPDFSSQQLIDLANARGGEDNVSVIVITVEQSDPHSGLHLDALLVDADEDDTLLLHDRPNDKHKTVELNRVDLEESTREPDPRDSVRGGPYAHDARARPPVYDRSEGGSDGDGAGEGRDTLASYQ